MGDFFFLPFSLPGSYIGVHLQRLGWSVLIKKRSPGTLRRRKLRCQGKHPHRLAQGSVALIGYIIRLPLSMRRERVGFPELHWYPMLLPNLTPAPNPFAESRRRPDAKFASPDAMNMRDRERPIDLVG